MQGNDNGDLALFDSSPGRTPGTGLRIAVAVDSLESSTTQGLARASSLGRVTDATLRLIHVRFWNPPIRGYGRFYYETSHQATSVVDSALARLWACNLRASGVVIDAPRSGIALAIAEEARDWEADMIVLAYHPRPAILNLVTGPPLATQLIREAACPVLVVPAEASDRS